MLAAVRRAGLVALALALVLAGLAGLAPRGAQAATTITNCTNLATVKTRLEVGGHIIVNCGLITLGFGSEIVIDSNTIIDGRGQTTISGGFGHRVFRITGSPAGVTVTLRGLAIVDGFASGDFPADAGAGIFADGSEGKRVTVRLEDALLGGNSTPSGSGGAVYNDGHAGNATLTATGTTFAGNAAATGGAVFNYGEGGSATLTTTDTTFDNNTAGEGGVVYNYAFGGQITMTATNTTFSKNSSSSDGGAVYNDSQARAVVKFVIRNSTFYGNTASNRGGAIFNASSADSSAILDLTNTTFSANTASSGADVYLWNSLGTSTLDATHVTIADSQAASSIYSLGGTTTLRASILINPSGAACVDGGGATFISLGSNVVSDATCNLTGPGDQPGTNAGPGDQPGTNAGPGALLDNGGPTQTYALFPDSPATDAADCFASRDQRGMPRPRDGNLDGTNRCDAGAYELAPLAILGTTSRPLSGHGRFVAGAIVNVYISFDRPGDLDILTSATMTPVTCHSHQPLGTAQPAASGGFSNQNNFERYVFIWKTDQRWPAGCRQLTLTFFDGSELRLNVEIVRLPR